MSAECTPAAPAAPRTRHPLALRMQCRDEWVNGQGTLAEVAKRHGVPTETVVAWYRRDNWKAARDRWLNKQLSDNDAPTQRSAHTPDPDNTHDARAREYDLHIRRLRDQLEVEKDPAKIDRLCAAIARLEDVYCRYAGIPLPGSLRPKNKRSTSRPYWEKPLTLKLAEPVHGHDWLKDSPRPTIESRPVPGEGATAQSPEQAGTGDSSPSVTPSQPPVRAPPAPVPNPILKVGDDIAFMMPPSGTRFVGTVTKVPQHLGYLAEIRTQEGKNLSFNPAIVPWQHIGNGREPKTMQST